MSQREINRFNTRVVLLGQTAHMRAAHRVAGFHAQRFFNMLNKGPEQVEKYAVCTAYGLGNGGVNQRTEDQRWGALVGGTPVNPRHHGFGFFDAIQIGDAYCVEFNLLKLGQNRVAESGGSNAGAVGNDKDGALQGIGHGAWRRTWRKRYNPARLTLRESLLSPTGRKASGEAGLLSGHRSGPATEQTRFLFIYR